MSQIKIIDDEVFDESEIILDKGSKKFLFRTAIVAKKVAIIMFIVNCLGILGGIFFIFSFYVYSEQLTKINFNLFNLALSGVFVLILNTANIYLSRLLFRAAQSIVASLSSNNSIELIDAFQKLNKYFGTALFIFFIELIYYIFTIGAMIHEMPSLLKLIN